MSRLPLAAALLALLAPLGASAHEVLHSVERGRAIAVKVYFPDGEPLAYDSCEIFSPADPKIPYQKGRTDRNGWVAFVPDVPGTWRVKVVDESGHGLDAAVEVGASGLSGPTRSPALSTLAFVLRPLAGVAAIAAVFLALFALHRRKGARS